MIPKFTMIPKHYRRMSGNETIRNADVWRWKDTGIFGYCNNKVDSKVSEHNPRFAFFRRRHVKVKKSNPVDKNPLVSFFYPSSKLDFFPSFRTVRLIAANDQYIVGLDVGDNYRFKKFLVSKAMSLKILQFNPKALL